MEWWQAVILGLVEGVTEFLPVSSTGHLIIASSLMGLGDSPTEKAALDSFNIVIQGGAILAVLGLYWPSVVRMVMGLLGRDAGGRRLAMNIIIAFVPAAVIGLLLEDWIEARLMSVGPVVAALIAGGVLMIGLERWRRAGARAAADPTGTPGAEGDGAGTGPDESGAADARGASLDSMTWTQALVIGLAQCVAMWPGTSRSMMTIVGGVVVGLRPKQAAEFSFLLGLPTLGAACIYKLGKNLWQARDGQTPSMFELLGVVPIVLGVGVATVSAFVAIKWLVSFLTRHGLEPFGWYRVALGGLLLALAMMNLVSVA